MADVASGDRLRAMLPAGGIARPGAEGSRDVWLLWRRGGIGASDAAAIVGLSPWATPYTVWLDKSGWGSPGGYSPAMSWGQRLEGAVCDAFGEERGCEVVGRGLWVVSSGNSLFRATLDGLAEVSGVVGVVEAKTSNGRDGTWDDGVPVHVQVQVQHQLMVTGLDVGWVAVLLGGQEFRTYEVERDEAAIAELCRLEAEFWERHVLAAIAPAVGGQPSVSRAIRDAFPAGREGQALELPAEALSMIGRLAQAKAEVREAKTHEAEAANWITALLQDNEIGTVGGKPVVTWRSSASRLVDVTRLRAEMPGLVAEYEKESVSRTLRLINRRDDDE